MAKHLENGALILPPVPLPARIGGPRGLAEIQRRLDGPVRRRAQHESRRAAIISAEPADGRLVSGHDRGVSSSGRRRNPSRSRGCYAIGGRWRSSVRASERHRRGLSLSAYCRLSSGPRLRILTPHAIDATRLEPRRRPARRLGRGRAGQGAQTHDATTSRAESTPSRAPSTGPTSRRAAWMALLKCGTVEHGGPSRSCG